jgi:hypothetical protein
MRRRSVWTEKPAARSCGIARRIKRPSRGPAKTPRTVAKPASSRTSLDGDDGEERGVEKTKQSLPEICQEHHADLSAARRSATRRLREQAA